MKDSLPLVSIVIPSYNSAIHISETLKSVREQCFRQWECLIIDDGSTDQTSKIILEYASGDERFEYYDRPSKKPKGANACRNIGIDNSRGEYLMFLDADDLITPVCLEERLKGFSQNETSDLVVSDTGILLDGTFKDKAINKDPEIISAQNYLNMFMSYELPWTIMSALWKRSFIENTRFDESLQRFQDIDFHISCLKKSPQIQRLKKIDNFYRLSSGKAGNDAHISSVLDNLMVFLQKHLHEILNNISHRKHLRLFVSEMLSTYIIPNYKKFRGQADSLLKFLYSSKLFTLKQKLLIKMRILLLLLGVDNLKNIGIHKFSIFMNRELRK